MELTAGAVFAGYRVLRQLGTGGMGSVYLVQHPRLPRQDAMKIIHSHLSSDPSFAARFEREAELACRLDHPALVRVHDRGCDEGRLWLTMQFVDGSDADQVLRREGPFAPPRVLRILEAVADGLDHAHDAGLVHRDVKPANILLSRRGTNGERAVLGDFGIARSSGATRLTDTGALLASLPYAAPEQLRDRPVTGAVDVYGLGCVVYELLTGRRVFDHGTPLVLLGAVLAGPRPETWDHLPPGRTALREALQQALAAEPEDRHPSCAALAAAVRDAMAPVPVTVVPVPVPVPVPARAVAGPAAAPPAPATPAGSIPAAQLSAAGPPDPWSAQPPPSSPPSPPSSWPPQAAVPSPVTPAAHWGGPGPGGIGAPTGPTGPYPSGPYPGGPYSGGPYTGESLGSGSHPAGAHSEGSRRRTRRRWPWLAAAVVLLLVAAAVGVVLWRPWALASPASVAADVRAGGVEIRWQQVAGATDYEVHRDGVLLDRADGTTYLDTDVGSGVRAEYSVAAVADDGERSDLVTATPVVSALHPVGDLSAEVLMTGVQLSWAPVDNAGHYEVRRDDEVLDDRAQGTTFLDQDPPPGRHDYTVVAVDDSGDAPSSNTSIPLEVSPWLAAADLAAAFNALVPPAPGPGGWGDATCAPDAPRSTVDAVAVIGCTLPNGVYVEFSQYPDQAALERRIATLTQIADPAFGTTEGSWYRQSLPGNDPAWEAWGLADADRQLMAIYIEWYGHTVADLDAAWYYPAPWR